MKSKNYITPSLIKKNHFKLEAKVDIKIILKSGGKYRNLFPKINFFEKNTLDFYDCMHELNLRLMECISIGLNLDS